MAKLSILVASASQTVNVFIQDSSVTTGAGKTGLAFNTGSLTAYYALPRAAPVAITLATQTVTGAFSSGGFVELDATHCPGLYRLDLPDAALASGRFVNVFLSGAANMAQTVLEIELTAVNNQDAVYNGMTVFTGSRAEPGQGAPAVNATFLAKIDYLYKAWRNKKTQTATTFSLFADDTTTVDQKATVSDDATTATVGEIATGP